MSMDVGASCYARKLPSVLPSEVMCSTALSAPHRLYTCFTDCVCEGRVALSATYERNTSLHLTAVEETLELRVYSEYLSRGL